MELLCFVVIAKVEGISPPAPFGEGGARQNPDPSSPLAPQDDRECSVVILSASEESRFTEIQCQDLLLKRLTESIIMSLL